MMEKIMTLENEGETCTGVIYHWLALMARGFDVKPEDLKSTSQQMKNLWRELSALDSLPKQQARKAGFSPEKLFNGVFDYATSAKMVADNLLDIAQGKGAFAVIWDNSHTIGAICIKFSQADFLWLLCDPNGGIYRCDTQKDFSNALYCSIDKVRGIMLMKPLPSLPAVKGQGLPKIPLSKGHLGGW